MFVKNDEVLAAFALVAVETATCLVLIETSREGRREVSLGHDLSREGRAPRVRPAPRSCALAHAETRRPRRWRGSTTARGGLPLQRRGGRADAVGMGSYGCGQ